MYVFNITTNIDETCEKEWLAWMQNTQIPAMLNTGKFVSAKMCKVLVEEALGGVTYSVQYTLENRKLLGDFYKTDAPLLKNNEKAKFGDKFVCFETEMQLIDKQFAPKTNA